MLQDTAGQVMAVSGGVAMEVYETKITTADEDNYCGPTTVHSD